MKAMQSAFSLWDEPWICALDRDGEVRELSMQQVLADSHRLRALAGDLPIQDFAILRLLLAVLHRAYDGPKDERAWYDVWKQPTLPVLAIDRYIQQYRNRFDLFHPRTPFYQVADLNTAKGETPLLAPLLPDVPNNVQYLSARLGPALQRIAPGEAARWLVACQAYDTSGIKPGAIGDPRVSGGKGYPIGTGLCGALGGIWLEGADLRQTLLLNLIPLDHQYLQRDPRDAPVWEREPQGPAEEDEQVRGPYGPLSLYTWQSRRIRLFRDVEGVTGALVSNGDKLAWEDQQTREPLTAWRRSANKEKELKREPVYVPRRHDPAKALWRGLNGILPQAAPAAGREAPAQLVPAVTQWLARLRLEGYVEPDLRITTRAVGIVYGTQQAVVDEIYHDAVTTTARAFDPASPIPTLIINAAADAEAAVKALRTLAANITRAAGGSGPPADGAAERSAEQAYMSLDHAHRRWLSTLAAESVPDQARTDWQRTVATIVRRLGQELVANCGPAARIGRAVNGTHLSSAQADLWFQRALARALPLTVGSREPSPNKRTPQQVEVPA